MAIERLMVVDEDEANLLFFQVLLKDLGFTQVRAISNATDSLVQAKAQDVQLMIVAWEMKSMAGTVLIQKLRALRGKKYVPYMIYSKRMSAEDARLAREVGIENLLSMPFDKTKASEMIRGIVAKENKPPYEETRLRKIDALLEENAAEEALKLIDERLRRPGPFFTRGQLALAQIWMQLNQLSKAEPVVRKILEKEQDHFEAQNILAQILSRTGRHAEGLAILESLVGGSTKNLTTLVTLGSAYVDANRHEDARKTFTQVEKMDQNNGKVRDEKGKLAFKEGDLSLAAQLLRETENGDHIARHFNNVAIGLVHRQEFDRAIETYEYALKLLAGRAKVHLLRYNLGLAFSKKGALAKSFMELAQSYKSDPSFEKAYVALARVSKKMQESGQSYDKQMAKEVNAARKLWKEKEAAKEAEAAPVSNISSF